MNDRKSFSSAVACFFMVCSSVFGQQRQPSLQNIPGRVQCEWYDTGGVGVAYHDLDSLNNGSGKLNPPDGSFLHEFRMHEGVDISFTKGRGIDDSPFNIVKPELDQLYVGWTSVGEWFRISVDVDKTATYQVRLMYTANGTGEINLSVDGMDLLNGIVPSTSDPRDSIAWRQWHHWNEVDLGKVSLKRGRHVLKVLITKNGNMNFDYLEFVKARD